MALRLTSSPSWMQLLAADARRRSPPADAMPAALEAARIEFLGAKSGRLKDVQKGLGAVARPTSPRPASASTKSRPRVEAAFDAARARLAQSATAVAADEPASIPRVPGTPLAARPPAPDHADDRRAEGHHGPARLHGRRRARDRRRVAQLRGAEHPARRIRPAIRWRIFISSTARDSTRRRRAAAAPQPDQHGADPRDGEAAAAGADHLAGPRLSARHGRRHALPDVPPDRRPAGRSRT